jgi:hypothetical protein
MARFPSPRAAPPDEHQPDGPTHHGLQRRERLFGPELTEEQRADRDLGHIRGHTTSPDVRVGLTASGRARQTGPA